METHPLPSTGFTDIQFDVKKVWLDWIAHKNIKNEGKSSEQRYCLILYISEFFLNIPVICHFVDFILHSFVKNTSSFEKKEKWNCTPLQKCCKHFGCLWIFFLFVLIFRKLFRREKINWAKVRSKCTLRNGGFS